MVIQSVLLFCITEWHQYCKIATPKPVEPGINDTYVIEFDEGSSSTGGNRYYCPSTRICIWTEYLIDDQTLNNHIGMQRLRVHESDTSSFDNLVCDNEKYWCYLMWLLYCCSDVVATTTKCVRTSRKGKNESLCICVSTPGH